MTVLAAPSPHICQLDIVDPDRREACGACSVAMIECAYGDSTAGAAVEAWLRARYGESGVVSGTVVSELLAYVATIDLGDRVTHVGRDLAAISAAIDAGSYVLVLFHDDVNADPAVAGPYEHFSVLCGVDGAVATLSNPWHRTLEDAVPLNTFFAALIDAVAIAPPTEGHDMLTAFDETPDGTQRSFWAATGTHHVIEDTRAASGKEWQTDHTAVNGFAPATGSGEATHSPDGKTVFLFYEAAAGRFEAWYDVTSGAWQTKQMTGPS
jgi:hypothetical protein